MVVTVPVGVAHCERAQVLSMKALFPIHTDLQFQGLVSMVSLMVSMFFCIVTT